MDQIILNSIDRASKLIGTTWPLYTFVTSNPLSGYENTSFKEAIVLAKKHLNTNSFPTAFLYKNALKKGNINKNILLNLLKENGYDNSPEYYLSQLESEKKSEEINTNHDVDRIMSKWLSFFMDEGLSEWNMPFKNKGFYKAWKSSVVYDTEVKFSSHKEIPNTSEEAINLILKDFNKDDYTDLFTYHLAALPGWTGYINHREKSNSDWQKQFPITLLDYLAVRLIISEKLNTPIFPEKSINLIKHTNSNLQYIWLKAWEQSWQTQLIKNLEKELSKTKKNKESQNPDAQLVFCIDTRSELIRRHIEAKGNYETFGYAGFFGIAMDYQNSNDGITRKSCPPIVNSSYLVSEIPQASKNNEVFKHQKKNEFLRFESYFMRRMKNMLPSAFGFVEGSGFFYGISLMAKTLLPGKLYKISNRNKATVENNCQPNINSSAKKETITSEIPLEEKVGIVKSAFDLMGWKEFAPLIVFVGHGSHSANNPFSSSLDCGACAASPGRHNARMLAKLANTKEVRIALAKIHNITIPEDTVFIGAEHNTTTDDIILFDSEVPISHKKQLQKLKNSLSKAKHTITQYKLGKSNSILKAQHKANDWSDTRPEWGLAKNAGFIIGPRKLTKNTNLDGRCFLHSYNWELDTHGKALESIMQGPMVVTQWINNHYYFSTVDNNVYGGGNKITHNITGKFGVVQGNGGDLKKGLPLQSLFKTDDTLYHEPLRLSVIIESPISRVSEILIKNDNLKTLLDNEWIYLLVMDPKQNNKMYQYKKSIQWISLSKEPKLETLKKNMIKELEPLSL